MPSCKWPRTVARGVSCPSPSALGTRSTCAGTAGSGVHLPAGTGAGAHPAGGGGAGQHARAGAPGRHGGPQKNGPQAIDRSRGGGTTPMHLVAAHARTAVAGALSPGQAGDGPQGRRLLRPLGPLANHERLPDDLARAMTRATRPGPWPRPWGTRWWCRRIPTAGSPGTTTVHCTSGATRRSGCSGGSIPASPSWTLMYWGFIQFALIVEALRIV